MSFLTDNLVGILVAGIVILIYFKIKKMLNYFSDRDLPYITPTLRDTVEALRVTAFNDMPNKMYDRTIEDEKPYVGFFMGFFKPAILIKDPSFVENILIKDFSHFQDHGFDFDVENNPLAGHLFNMKGDEWRTLRHKLVPTFTSGKLRGMVPIMEECADKFIQEMETDPSLKTDTNLKTLFKKYSLAVIASCAFGIDPDSVKDPNCEFVKVLHTMVNPNIIARLRFIMAIMFPKLTKLFKVKMFAQEAEDFMISLTKQSLELRKKSGEKRNDFMQLLLELKEKGSVDMDVKELEQDEKDTIASMEKDKSQSKLEFTYELLAAQVFVFLIGGFENTAYVVAVTEYCLSKHPDLQKKVREEVVRLKNKHGRLDYQALRDMPLLGACIDEALRMYPPGAVFFRECNKAYTFPDGKKIDKGTLVLMPAQSFQKDSRYWSDPDVFNPDRFLNGETIMPGTFMPFGDGPRICIAQRMALINIKMILAKLLLKYELVPSPKTKEPIRIVAFAGADNDGGFWGSFKNLQ